jgi:hypothetical protein
VNDYLLVQAMGLGRVASLAEPSDLVCRAFEVNTCEPRRSSDGDEAHDRNTTAILISSSRMATSE